MAIPVTRCSALAVMAPGQPSLPAHPPMAAAVSCHTQVLPDFPNFGLALHGCEVLTIPTVLQGGGGSIRSSVRLSVFT